MSTKRSGVSCVALKGELYALGGFDGARRLRTCEKYDIKTKKWEPIADMMTPRSNFSAVVVEDTIMAIGGFNGFSTSELVECYDPDTNSWCSSSDLQVHRSALSVCMINGCQLSTLVTEKYMYPNRNRLPEEKRLYERTVENISFPDAGNHYFGTENTIDHDAEEGLAQEIGVDMNIVDESSGDENMVEAETSDEEEYTEEDTQDD